MALISNTNVASGNEPNIQSQHLPGCCQSPKSTQRKRETPPCLCVSRSWASGGLGLARGAIVTAGRDNHPHPLGACTPPQYPALRRGYGDRHNWGTTGKKNSGSTSFSLGDEFRQSTLSTLFSVPVVSAFKALIQHGLCKTLQSSPHWSPILQTHILGCSIWPCISQSPPKPAPCVPQGRFFFFAATRVQLVVFFGCNLGTFFLAALAST